MFESIAFLIRSIGQLINFMATRMAFTINLPNETSFTVTWFEILVAFGIISFVFNFLFKGVKNDN